MADPVAKAPAPKEGVLDVVQDEVETVYHALRDFSAHIETQLITFVKGEKLAAHVGAQLLAKGAPIAVSTAADAVVDASKPGA